MFGFNKKKEKKQSNLDKILMGVVVGGAIGSVLGVSLAPKKGSETRKAISRHTGSAYKHAKKSVFGLTGKLFRKKSSTPEHHGDSGSRTSSSREK